MSARERSEEYRLHEPGEWSLGELTDQVAAELSALDDTSGETPRVNGRVRDVPDARTIRWYQTLGIVDRPTLRGRAARYHRRHLLQLLAIKRMQARGATLSTIQAQLAGLADTALERLVRPASANPQAAGPVAAGSAIAAGSIEETSSTEEATSAEAGGPGRFWASRPTASYAPAGTDALGTDAQQADAPQTDTLQTDTLQTGAATAVSGVHLADGLILLLDDPARPLDHNDRHALHAAARELVAEIHRRGLARRGGPRSATHPHSPTRPKEHGR